VPADAWVPPPGRAAAVPRLGGRSPGPRRRGCPGLAGTGEQSGTQARVLFEPAVCSCRTRPRRPMRVGHRPAPARRGSRSGLLGVIGSVCLGAFAAGIPGDQWPWPLVGHRPKPEQMPGPGLGARPLPRGVPQGGRGWVVGRVERSSGPGAVGGLVSCGVPQGGRGWVVGRVERSSGPGSAGRLVSRGACSAGRPRFGHRVGSAGWPACVPWSLLCLGALSCRGRGAAGVALP